MLAGNRRMVEMFPSIIVYRTVHLLCVLPCWNLKFHIRSIFVGRKFEFHVQFIRLIEPSACRASFESVPSAVCEVSLFCSVCL